MTKKQLRAAQYTRQSTDGPGHQEGSCDRQADELARLIEREKLKLLRKYIDPGVSGWKDGAKRPDFDRMVRDCEKHRDIDVLCVDQFDRFSRADFYECVELVNRFRRAGVQRIQTSSECIDLVTGGTMAAITLAFKACAAHQYVQDQSRRVAQKAVTLAQSGRRVGGAAPYGYSLVREPNVKGVLIAVGLKLGEPDEVATVRFMYQSIADGRSIHWVAGELSRRGIKTARGKDRWFTDRVRWILRNPVYRGAFAWNGRAGGMFNFVDPEGRVVDAKTRELDDEGKPVRPRWRQSYDPADGCILIEDAHPAIIDRKLWDKVQRRLDSNQEKKRKPRAAGFTLAGVLICGHCGRPLYGARYDGVVEYRCDTARRKGKGACEHYAVQEHRILPVVLKHVGEGMAEFIESVQAINHLEPLESPSAELERQKAHLEARRVEVDAEIELGVANMMTVTDTAIRQRLDAKLAALQATLAEIDKQLAAGIPEKRLSTEEISKTMAALHRQCDPFLPLIRPLDPSHPMAEYCDGKVSLLDPLAVREGLQSLGIECSLRWESKTVTHASGRESRRHTLQGGRIQVNGESTAFKSSELAQVIEHSAGPSSPTLAVRPRSVRPPAACPCRA